MSLKPGRSEDLGFPEFGACDPARAKFSLPPSDFDRTMSLDVGPQAYPVLLSVFGRAGEVSLETRSIDQNCRCCNFVVLDCLKGS